MINAIKRAYQIMTERKWDSIYWAIDLHGVCFKSNYEQGGYQWINDRALPALREIVVRPENKIILWSSCHPDEYPAIIKFFEDQGIRILAFNENPEAKNTASGNFDTKFYFSVLLDDKAGFDPDVDWLEIQVFFTKMAMADEQFTGVRSIKLHSEVLETEDLTGSVSYLRYVDSDEDNSFPYDYDLQIVEKGSLVHISSGRSSTSFQAVEDARDDANSQMEYFQNNI